MATFARSTDSSVIPPVAAMWEGELGHPRFAIAIASAPQMIRDGVTRRLRPSGNAPCRAQGYRIAGERRRADKYENTVLARKIRLVEIRR